MGIPPGCRGPTNVVHQVQRVYNGLGQLITEYQAQSGAVNTQTTPQVQYAYSEMASGANHSRLVSMTYPNGRVLNYNYAGGLDSSLSRLSSLSDTSATLEAYSYLGLHTVVTRAHPEPDIDLTYVKRSGDSNGEAGDPYSGLDHFGRVVAQQRRRFPFSLSASVRFASSTAQESPTQSQSGSPASAPRSWRSPSSGPFDRGGHHGQTAAGKNAMTVTSNIGMTLTNAN